MSRRCRSRAQLFLLLLVLALTFFFIVSYATWRDNRSPVSSFTLKDVSHTTSLSTDIHSTNSVNMEDLSEIISYKLELPPRKVPDREELMKLNPHLFSVVPPQFLPNIRSPCWYEEFTDELASNLYSNNLFYLVYESVEIQLRKLKPDVPKYLQHVNGKQYRLRCLAYAYIMGQPKCGTSDLFFRMKMHPQIGTVLTKEPHWWSWIGFGESPGGDGLVFGGLLTSTGDVVGRWKEYFEDLINPTDTSSVEVAEAEDSAADPPMSCTEVTEVIKKLLGGKAPGVDEICPQYLRSLDVVGLSGLTHLCSIVWQSGTDLQHALGQFAAECEAAGMRISTSKSSLRDMRERQRERGGGGGCRLKHCMIMWTRLIILTFNFLTVDGSTSTMWNNQVWGYYYNTTEDTEPRVMTMDFIHAVTPQAKFIAILRDPGERLFSEYLYCTNGNKSVQDFHVMVEESVQMFYSCLSKRSFRWCVYETEFNYQMPAKLNVGMYVVFLMDWIGLYGRDHIFIVRFEDYANNLVDELNRAYKFLNIDPLTAEEEALVNSKPAWNTRKAEDKPLGDMLPETKELLREFYWPFNVKLASVLDDEGFHWNADPILLQQRRRRG
ncbi:carbohydrate sulfotransferase 15-like [Cynoglossus semilaevis]|uniref:carbohydrate sulfotransferase 15-like n=1 Tax=Cynoglossus semilaevis TaxID=244447 RepID=UPI00049806DA|nr:carbohydrate sulfotransferase 15-like [Cynoglossus semilaevis]